MVTDTETILAFHAHPDDTEVFCSGTLALLAKAGYRVVIATATGGGMGGMGEGEQRTVERRLEEAKEAAEVIGAEYACLGGRDGFLFDSEGMRIAALEVIRRYSPKLVLTHLPFDYHSDHRVTSNIVEVACMLSTLSNAPAHTAPIEKTPLLYHTAPLRMRDNVGRPVDEPDFYVDVTEVMETKMKMLGCHETQQVLMRRMHGMDDFFGEMREFTRQRGIEAGCAFAEAFWQHAGGGFETVPLLQNFLRQYAKTGVSAA